MKLPMEEIREYIKEELKNIKDYNPLFDIFCIVLKENGTRYHVLRSARMKRKQLNLFDMVQKSRQEKKHDRSKDSDHPQRDPETKTDG